MCFEYDECAEVYSESLVKTRKPHKCAGCRKQIERGSIAKVCSGRIEGSWFREYVCERCERVTLSIVAEELKEGCHWSEAWCAPSDLEEYLRYRRDPLPLLGMRTLDDCRRYVNDLWERTIGRITLDLMM